MASSTIVRYTCHDDNTAGEHTFMQSYPSPMAVVRRHRLTAGNNEGPIR